MNDIKKREDVVDGAPKDPVYIDYIKRLLKQKPWLDSQLLRGYKLNSLKISFPLKVTFATISGHKTIIYLQEELDLEDENTHKDFEKELQFIREIVEPYRNKPREAKSDIELAYDVRYYNKYSEFLISRVQSKNFYERLGSTPPSNKVNQLNNIRSQERRHSKYDQTRLSS